MAGSVRRRAARRPAPPTVHRAPPPRQTGPPADPIAPAPPAPERVLLAFDPAQRDDDAVRLDLSAITRVGDELWMASDEHATVERLSLGLGGAYDRHARFRLADTLDLPGDDDDEIDVEGLDFDGGHLWIVGSHSVRRRQPGDEGSTKKRLRRLAKVDARGNRFLLARIPLRRAADGAGWELCARCEDVSAPGGWRHARRLPGGRKHNALSDALAKDEHLAPFLDIPGKDNGFDVEGLAVFGDRVFLGLRGPVLRGWATVLGLRVGDDPDDERRLRLRGVGDTKRPYAKHLLDLRGLGVRELCRDGDDLLVLAGPTMQLDGRATVFRWRDVRAGEGDGFVERDELEPVLELPYGQGTDEGVEHPEGIALTRTADGRKALLVVYDSPRASRRRGDSAVEADVYPLE